MHLLQNSFGIVWKELLLGGEDWSFLLETILRTLIMFMVVLISLRLLGKRGVKQLSIFELVVIIGLGSAAGDPMFYKDVGILPALIVFTMVISFYSLITYLIGKNKKFELLVEGGPVSLIKEGVFAIENFKKQNLGEDEFFAELRMQNVSQLGQIEQAIEESSGNISIFYYAPEEVKYGLPILPGSLDNCIESIESDAHYSCIFCGYTKLLTIAAKHTCPACKRSKWVKASNKKRVS